MNNSISTSAVHPSIRQWLGFPAVGPWVTVPPAPRTSPTVVTPFCPSLELRSLFQREPPVTDTGQGHRRRRGSGPLLMPYFCPRVRPRFSNLALQSPGLRHERAHAGVTSAPTLSRRSGGSAARIGDWSPGCPPSTNVPARRQHREGALPRVKLPCSGRRRTSNRESAPSQRVRSARTLSRRQASGQTWHTAPRETHRQSGAIRGARQRFRVCRVGSLLSPRRPRCLGAAQVAARPIPADDVDERPPAPLSARPAGVRLIDNGASTRWGRVTTPLLDSRFSRGQQPLNRGRRPG